MQSDSYVAISDMEAAENARQTLIKDINSIDFSSVEDEDLLPIIFVNSAIWAKNQQLENQCADILFYIVNKWPTFVPGLILYSDFAFESNKKRTEDSEMLNLRNAGIFSKEMELYDSRRKIPLSDALYRIEKALKECKVVIWNGPVGLFEFDQFAVGTNSIARALADIDAIKIIGGGDSAAAVEKAL